jgi:hypothetical protein
VPFAYTIFPEPGRGRCVSIFLFLTKTDVTT